MAGALALGAVGCSSDNNGDTGNGGAASGGTLNVRIAGAMISTDPFAEIGTNPWMLLRQMYEGLTSLDNNFSAIPMLAESWDVSDDGLEYTFELRDDAVFHDGSTMDSADVVYSLNYYRENATRASQLANISDVTASDDTTVVISLKSPQGNLPELLGQPIVIAIVPEGAADNDGLVNDPIGTGPFKIKDFANENRAVLEKFDEYAPVDVPASEFGGHKEALVDEVVIEAVQEAQTAVAGIETGLYDVALNVPVQDVDRIDGFDGVSVQSAPGTNIHAMYVATASPVVDDPEVRKAIYTAIDRQRLLDTTVKGYGVIANSYAPDVVSWFDEAAGNYWPYEYSVENAIKLREASSYNGEPIEIIAGAPTEQGQNATLIGQMLEEAGFTIDIQKLDHATYQSRLNAGDFQLASTGSPIRTPADLLYNEWTCNGTPKRFGYCNEEYDALYAEAVSTGDADERKAKFAQLERMLKDDAVVSPWYYIDTQWAVSDKLEGVTVAKSNFFSAWNISKKS